MYINVDKYTRHRRHTNSPVRGFPHQTLRTFALSERFEFIIFHHLPSFFVLPISWTPKTKQTQTTKTKQTQTKQYKPQQPKANKTKNLPTKKYQKIVDLSLLCWRFDLTALHQRRRRCRDQPYLDEVAFSMPWEHCDLQAEISPY